MLSRLARGIAFLALSLGCSNQSTPTSTQPPAAIAQSAQLPGGGDAKTIVTAHVETDFGINGTIDVRQTAITAYDQSGNVLSYVVESLANGEVRRQETTYTYNKWGNVLSELVESIAGGGSVSSRSLLRTIEVDQRGNPTSQWYEEDWGGDGNPEVLASSTFTSYDHRSKPITEIQQVDFAPYGVFDTRVTRTTSYDAKGNLVYLLSESDFNVDGTPDRIETRTSTYNAHGALLEESVEVDTGTEIFRYGTTTLELDAQGNPTLQVITGVGGVGSRMTISTEFDHRRPISQIVEVDTDGNGTIDGQTTITYEYGGSGPTPNVSKAAFARSGGGELTHFAGSIELYR